MSWQSSSIEQERLKFIGDWLKGEYTMTELCERYQVSRPTGYKLVNRFQEEGETAIYSRSSARHHHPNITPDPIEDAIIELKLRYPKWGPVPIKSRLEHIEPTKHWPVASTVGEVLKRHGLVKPRKYRKKVPPYTQPFKACDKPNAVWSIDYKGQFKLGNGRWCYPLTLTDNYSRYILGCEALYHPRLCETQKALKKIFKRYGLPDTIRSDNGTPFSSTSIGGLSRLAVWWIKLGITPERIMPGRPEQNGRHERMHRTLKAYTTTPASESLVGQQKRFDEFMKEYNTERPHQGINNAVPSEIYVPSAREYTDKPAEITYRDGLEIRKVRSSGEIKWRGKKYYVAELLYGEPVGIEEIDEDRGILYYSNLKLGLIDIRKEKINKLID